ncbi:glycosyltransferase [Brachybacterium aquaticum]|uniref:GT2 family glycosyltransferase n=1 Tax=Brachybacterium aquaticum TaxID=1432564 RepID=A0A841AAD8_9MICO|nr:glycosyltransferase [Brachybacterium aquaticum]MBB5830917.1 GT2 family glycosyltransferase [Brachybacterium aquaticum]
MNRTAREGSRPQTEPATTGAHPQARSERVVAVVVTYNREQLLADCLDGLAAQDRRPDAVVVIDNASTDRSGAVADGHPLGADVVHLRRNVGGAGGFAAGIARALVRHDADWVWVMDDDTVPRPGALSALLEALSRSPVRLSVLSSRAVWTDGREHPMNRSRTRLGASAQEKADAARAGGRPIRTASYVSALLNGEDVRRLGLPYADYFIWSDDFEHTGRLLRRGRGIHVPASVVEHRTARFDNAQANPGSRFYYDVRNRLWALLRTDSFTVPERILHGGRTALGWAGMLLRHRGDLLGVGLRGLLAALRRGPRPSATVLAADGEAAADVRAIERAAAR